MEHRFHAGLSDIQKSCFEIIQNFHARHHMAAAISDKRMRLAVYRDNYNNPMSPIKTKCLEVAVNLRSFLDASQSNYLDQLLRSYEHKGLSYVEETGEAISIREICNKIIHAKEISFDMAQYHSRYDDTEFNRSVEDEWVNIIGKKGKKYWKCRLNVIRFAELVYQFADDWLTWDPSIGPIGLDRFYKR